MQEQPRASPQQLAMPVVMGLGWGIPLLIWGMKYADDPCGDDDKLARQLYILGILYITSAGISLLMGMIGQVATLKSLKFEEESFTLQFQEGGRR